MRATLHDELLHEAGFDVPSYEVRGDSHRSLFFLRAVLTADDEESQK